MSKKNDYNTVVVTQEPRGRFLSGYIASGETPKPGTVVQIKASTEPVNGLFTFEIANMTADGYPLRGPMMVLVEDWNQGKTIDDAYAAGEMCMVYCPLPGDELLMIIGDVGGTADSHAIGEQLQVDDGTGELVAAVGTDTTKDPFTLLETLAALTADTHSHVMFNG